MTQKNLIFTLSLLILLLLGTTNSLAVENCSPSGSLSGTYTCSGATTTYYSTTVESGNSTTLKAGQSITLKPGFWAKAGSTFITVIDVTLNDDSDNDGMPDAWEIQYGLNPNLNDADADYDNDGVSNYLEYVFHTDPTNPNDKPADTSKGITYQYDELGRIKSITRVK